MKRFTFKLFIFIGILTTSFLISCSKDQEINPATELSSAEMKDGEMHWNTDARMATIYALQYSRIAINPEFVIEPKSEQLPIFISGKKAMEYINFDKLPYKKKELEFINQQLYKPGSRAVLMRNIPSQDGKQIGNIVYVIYEKGLKVPVDFVNQFGAFLDNFEDDGCDWVTSSFGNWGNGSGCFCHHIMTCNYSEWCWSCPETWKDFRGILKFVNIHPDLLVNPLKAFYEYLPIPEIPLGESIFDQEKKF